MRPLPFLVSQHQFRTGLQVFLAGMFPITLHRQDVRNLPPYLLRDIGLDERKKPDWKHDLL
jgi:hypothetical protein